MILTSLLAACGESTHESAVTLVGECDPAVGSVDVPAATIDLVATDCLLERSSQLDIVDSAAQWDALFDCDQPVPPQLDFATQRAAVVHVSCTPIDFQFASEAAGDVVVGVLTRVSGACLGNILVVPLPKSTKPVRLATCQESCATCPPSA